MRKTTAYRNLEKPLVKWLLGSPRKRWEDDIKMDLTVWNIIFEDGWWLKLAWWDCTHWRVLVLATIHPLGSVTGELVLHVVEVARLLKGRTEKRMQNRSQMAAYSFIHLFINYIMSYCLILYLIRHISLKFVFYPTHDFHGHNPPIKLEVWQRNLRGKWQDSKAVWLSQRPGLMSRAVHVGFVVDRGEVELVSVRVLWFYPVNIIPLLLHILSCVNCGLDSGPIGCHSFTVT
jgi:hypothetical protein